MLMSTETLGDRIQVLRKNENVTKGFCDIFEYTSAFFIGI